MPGAWLTRPYWRPKSQKVHNSPSYSASAPNGEADEPCPAGAGCEGVLGLLTEAQEVWALRKMGFFKMGERSRNALDAPS